MDFYVEFMLDCAIYNFLLQQQIWQESKIWLLQQQIWQESKI
jgi:hypothetical protein